MLLVCHWQLAQPGLWTPTKACPPEAVRHVQSRVAQFDAMVPWDSELRDIPLCPMAWAYRLVSEATACSRRDVVQLGADERAFDGEDL